MYTNEEKAKMMVLPLIELDKNGGKDTDIIVKGIKDVFGTKDLLLINEYGDDDGGKHMDFSHRDGDLTDMVYASYYSESRYIKLTIEFDDVPRNKRKKMMELINLLNIYFPFSCTIMRPEGNVAIRSVMALSSWFNTQELYINLGELLLNGFFYIGAVTRICRSDETPECVIKHLAKCMWGNQAE